MADIAKYTPGTFCWADLGTTDTQAAKAFYGALFGWGAVDTPASHGMVYTMLQADGKDAAALYPLMPEQVSQGVPPHWMLYVSVENAAAMAARAKELGGTVIAGPGEVPEAGRFAILRDPQGAVFGLWQPGAHIGARTGQVPGTLCWSELATSDAAGAQAFYTGLFGWEATKSTLPGMDYTMFQAAGSAAGGMLQMTSEWQGAPPHWMPYFLVADCDATAARAETAGGKVCVPPTDIPTVGRFAVLNDGQGAYFAIIRLQESPATA